MRGCAQRRAPESSLQQRHQARVPVAEHEEQQEWNGDVVPVLDRAVDRQQRNTRQSAIREDLGDIHDK